MSKLPITARSTDPVFVKHGSRPASVELRIGESMPGKSRFSWLSPSEARKVAIALLQVAEAIDERLGNTKIQT